MMRPFTYEEITFKDWGSESIPKLIKKPKSKKKQRKWFPYYKWWLNKHYYIICIG
jgi:hypothetical protein